MTTENAVLRSSVPVLAPVWILSLLAGVVYKFSLWFGITLTLPLIYFVCSAMNTMGGATKVHVKVLEAVLLNLAIPLLSTMTSLSSIHYSMATTPLMFILVASAAPHYQLLFLTIKKIYHPYQLLFVAFFIYLEGMIGMFLMWDLECPLIILGWAINALYGLFCICLCIHQLRDKLPICLLQLFFKFLYYAFAFASYVYSFIDPSLSPVLAALAASSAIIYYCLEWVGYEMSFHPEAEGDHVKDALAHAICKLLPSVLFVLWGVGAALLSMNDPNLACSSFLLYWMFLIILHWIHEWIKIRNYQPAPTSPMNAKACFTVLVIIMVIAMKVSVAAYNWEDSNHLEVPKSLQLMLTALLIISTTNVSAHFRVALTPYHKKIFLSAMGLFAYTFASGWYMCGTAVEVKEKAQEVTSEVKATGNAQSDAGLIRALSHPLTDILLTTLSLCFVLMINIGYAMDEEDKVQAEMKAKEAANPAGFRAFSVNKEADNDSDSDYNSQLSLQLPV